MSLNINKCCNNKFKDKVSFAIGTGRCGTKFLHKLLALESNVASSHERNYLNEAFHRYCKWYELPVDHAGFIRTKSLEIQDDLEIYEFSFEASAHLSISVQELYDCSQAKFILLVRSPDKVVNSYLCKGWYDQPAIRENPHLAPSYQDCRGIHHFLGRIMPSGKKFLQWNQMSRVGKLAWYWSALNAKVLEQFENIPDSHWRIERLEDFSYSLYLEIACFLGFQPTLTLEQYAVLATSRPNAFANIPSIETWTGSEIAEFESEVAPMADKLGYEYKVRDLLSGKTLSSRS